MPEVSPVAAPNSANRSIGAATPDNVARINASSVFRGHLRAPPQRAHSAHGPVSGGGLAIDSEKGVESHVAKRKAGPCRDDEANSGGPSDRPKEGVLDSFWCQMAMHPGFSLAPVSGQATVEPSPPCLREDLQGMLNGLARRVAWGGDRRKGSARIELSEGVLAGATLVVHTEHRSVSVEIELPGGTSADHGLRQRILERLEGRGFAARVQIE
jgi:hypothetical protein